MGASAQSELSEVRHRLVVLM